VVADMDWPRKSGDFPIKIGPAAADYY